MVCKSCPSCNVLVLVMLLGCYSCYIHIFSRFIYQLFLHILESIMSLLRHNAHCSLIGCKHLAKASIATLHTEFASASGLQSASCSFPLILDRSHRQVLDRKGRICLCVCTMEAAPFQTLEQRSAFIWQGDRNQSSSHLFLFQLQSDYLIFIRHVIQSIVL